MRTQAGMGNSSRQIPHHSGAILMCRQANITDEEIVKLCQQIEIDQMKAIPGRS
jgi:uncharacterized protein (DUF305 family)